MSIIHIPTPDDPRLAPYVSIRERDLTGGADGRFIVEGKVTLSILLERSRFPVESVFVGEARLDPLAPLLERVPEDVPVYVAPQPVMDAVAGFPIHRGVLACARKAKPLAMNTLLQGETLLVLNNISNHDNVGAAFRNAAAFGADGVLLDAQSCDPLYRKSIRVSAGAALWLPYVRVGDGASHVEALLAAGFAVWAMTPRADAWPLHRLAVDGKTAILLGAEGPGLSDDLIGRCRPVRIAMAEDFDSINVATAGAIALSHLHAAK